MPYKADGMPDALEGRKVLCAIRWALMPLLLLLLAAIFLCVALPIDAADGPEVDLVHPYEDVE